MNKRDRPIAYFVEESANFQINGEEYEASRVRQCSEHGDLIGEWSPWEAEYNYGNDERGSLGDRFDTRESAIEACYQLERERNRDRYRLSPLGGSR